MRLFRHNPPSSSANFEGRRLLFVAPAHGNLKERMTDHKKKKKIEEDERRRRRTSGRRKSFFCSHVRALLRHLLPGARAALNSSIRPRSNPVPPPSKKRERIENVPHFLLFFFFFSFSFPLAFFGNGNALVA